MKHITLLMIILIMSASLAACGGGGGGNGDSGSDDSAATVDDGDNTMANQGVNYATDHLPVIDADDRDADTGAGAHVTLFTSGVRTSHQEFTAATFDASVDVTSGNNPNEDSVGFGTSKAGLVAGQNVGVAPGATINNIKFYDLPPATASNHLKALNYAEANLDTDVLLLDNRLDRFEDEDVEFERTLPDAASNGDWVVIEATPAANPDNSRHPVVGLGTQADFPEYGGRALVVGATDGNGNLREDSATAYAERPSQDQNIHLHFVVAPGENICSSAFAGEIGNTRAAVCNQVEGQAEAEGRDDSYANLYGSTPAAALVTGVAAAVRGAYPDLGAAQVIDVLMCSADDLGASGYDDQYGAGRINLKAALALAESVSGGAGLGDCDIPAELTESDVNSGPDSQASRYAVPADNESTRGDPVAPGVRLAPVGTTADGCTRYVNVDGGQPGSHVYFRNKRGGYSASSAGCLATVGQ